LSNGLWGKFRGVVVKGIDDPEKRGRVQVRVPDALGESEVSWAEPCTPYAGPEGVGFFTLPPPDTHVWVEFLGGDAGHPILAGCFWETGDDVPAEQATAGQKVLKTKAGTIKVDDSANEVTIQTSRGAKIVLGAQEIEISNGKGASIKLSGSQISLNNGALEVT
jgi:uncharacterized protein involved in type VI secretion and phage assembly